MVSDVLPGADVKTCQPEPSLYIVWIFVPRRNILNLTAPGRAIWVDAAANVPVVPAGTSTSALKSPVMVLVLTILPA